MCPPHLRLANLPVLQVSSIQNPPTDGLTPLLLCLPRLQQDVTKLFEQLGEGEPDGVTARLYEGSVKHSLLLKLV